jgi:hypothetical protein
VKAAKTVVAKGGSVKAALLDAGYSPNTAKTPRKVTDQEAWKKLMKKYLDDDKLAKKHDQLLDSVQLSELSFSQQILDEEIERIITDAGFNLVQIESIDTADPKFRRKVAYYTQPNAKALKEAIDMAYKLKGKYAPEKVETTNIQAEEDRIMLRDLIRSFRNKK